MQYTVQIEETQDIVQIDSKDFPRLDEPYPLYPTIKDPETGQTRFMLPLITADDYREYCQKQDPARPDTQKEVEILANHVALLRMEQNRPVVDWPARVMAAVSLGLVGSVILRWVLQLLM